MIKHSVLAFATASALAATSAHAIETQTKQELTALSTIAVATAAAGPVGFVLGTVGGIWLVDQVGEAAQFETATVELAAAEAQLAATEANLRELRGQLAGAKQEQAKFARMALEQLQLEMLFKTGEAKLTPQGESRLALLASFLSNNPDLDILIEGFADPRGDAKANQRLSEARAKAVAGRLAAVGIEPNRMTVLGHGEQQSMAVQGDSDAYALERRVSIEINRRDSGRKVAGVTVGDRP